MDTTLIHQFPYVGLFVLLVLGVIGFPFPEDAILILCGFLIANKVVQPVNALLVVASGMIMTDYFLYHVGRKFGRKIVAHKRFRKIISARREMRLEELFRRWGVVVILLGRHLVGLLSQIFLVAGILRMPRPRFIAADAISSVVTISIMVGAGYWGGSTLDLIKHNMEEARNALLILIAIAAVALIVWLLAVGRLRSDDDIDGFGDAIITNQMKATNLKIIENRPLNDMTTFGVGGPARYFTEASAESDIAEALAFAKIKGVPALILGGGSNVLISDEGFPGLVIRNRIRGFMSREEGDDVLVYAGAGEEWQQFVDRCVASGWQGVECLAGIPGTVGASPVQNIGAYGQDVSQVIAGVRAIDTGTGASVYFSREECCFGYRKSMFNSKTAGKYVITGVTFRLKQGGAPAILYKDLEKYFEGVSGVTLAQLREAVISIRDSKGLLIREGREYLRSAGSFFRNPVAGLEKFREIEAKVEGAGGCANWAWPMDSGDVKLSAACLIQNAGFSRGYRKGNVGISPKHSLIIVNYGGATAAEIADFAGEVQKKVSEVFGVFLVPEVRLVGFPPGVLRLG